MSQCSICRSKSNEVETCTILKRHQAVLFSCPQCGFLYFDKPHWLEEAYSDSIATTDTGILTRNRKAVVKTASLLMHALSATPDKKYLDYAGGYGLFVRGMRDAGFNFYWSDPYTQNLVARGYEHDANSQYDAVTAFEVFEHVPDPVEFAKSALREANGARTLIFTTNTFEGPPPPLDWWYYSFETGQHISFYQPKTLQAIADALDMRFFSFKGYHLFTRDAVAPWRIRLSLSAAARFIPLLHAEFKSKTMSDHHALAERI